MVSQNSSSIGNLPLITPWDLTYGITVDHTAVKSQFEQGSGHALSTWSSIKGLGQSPEYSAR